jgi:hypothetical protein
MTVYRYAAHGGRPPGMPPLSQGDTANVLAALAGTPGRMSRPRDQAFWAAAKRALARYLAGEQPLAEVWRSGYGCAIMDGDPDAVPWAEAVAATAVAPYGRPDPASARFCVVLRDGWAPAAAGWWMDFPEPSWGISDSVYDALPRRSRARLEAQEQVSRYVEQQFSGNWLSLYHPATAASLDDIAPCAAPPEALLRGLRGQAADAVADILRRTAPGA